MNENSTTTAAPAVPRQDIPLYMEAAVISAPRTITFEKVTLPVLEDDQALVKLEGCGLCASSTPVWEGRDWFTYPQAAGSPGHEGWGTVVEAGSRSAFQPGQRVATLVGNAFAPYVVVGVDQAVELPPTMDAVPFPGEPMGCVMNVLDRAGLKEGNTAVVIGLGFIGLLTAELAARRGVKVIALSRRRSSLERLKGDMQRIQYADHWQAIREVMELTGGRGAGHVIECTGHQIPMDMATDMVAEGGRIIIAGYHQDGLRQVDMQKWNWKGIDVINAHERDPRRYIRGIREAAAMVENGLFDPRDLISHWFAFEELQEAMDLAASSAEGLVKACIRFPK